MNTIPPIIIQLVGMIHLLLRLYYNLFFDLKSNKKERTFQNNCAKVRGILYFLISAVIKLFC